jgi:hypothetical protein
LEGARLSREVGDLYYRKRMLMNPGLVAMANGDLPASKRRLIEGLTIAKQNDNRLGQSSFVRLLGEQAMASGQARLAARLLGAAEGIGATAGAGATGQRRPGRLEADLDSTRDRAIAPLGGARFEAEYVAGERLSREAALRLALRGPDDTDAEAGAAAHGGTGHSRSAKSRWRA